MQSLRSSLQSFFCVEEADPKQKRIQTALYWYVLFLCVFIPFRGILELWLGSSLIKLLPDILLLGLFVWIAASLRFRFQWKWQDFLLIAFFAVGAVNSLFLQHSGLLPLVFQIRSIGVYYLLYFLLRQAPLSREEFSKIVTVLKGVGTVLFIFSLIEKIASKTVLFPSAIADKIIYASNFTRTYSLLFNPNNYGMFLVLLCLLCLYRQIRLGKKTSALFYAVIGAGLLLSMSRSGLIALVAGLALVLLWQLIETKGKLPYKKLGVSALIALVLSFGLYYATTSLSGVYYHEVLAQSENNSTVMQDAVEIGANDRIESTITDQEIQNSNTNGRLYIVKQGIEIWQDYPILGTGIGTYGSAASTNYQSALVEKYDLPFPLYSDNQYISVFVETGLLGTLLFLAFLGSILYTYRKDPTKLIFCILIGWFGVFYNIFEVQIGAFLLWSFLGTDLPLNSSAASLSKETQKPLP